MRFVLLLSFFFIPLLSINAQVSADSLVGTQLSIKSVPEYPGPFETVELSLDDYSGFVFGASVEWFYNDVPIPGSTNQRNIAVSVGEAGSRSVVSVVLKRSDGTSTTLTRVFEPVYIDIIVEPQTHVPNFYMGRALPSAGSVVSLSALLNDGTQLGTDYVYLWRVNRDVIERGALRGGYTVSFVMPQDSYTIVSLQVSRPDGTIVGSRSTLIPLVSPQLHFYEVNALYGVETRSLTALNLIGSSVTLMAEPYYLDSRTFNNPDILEWNINSETFSGDANNPYLLTLERTGYPGTTRLEFQVQNTTQFLQGVTKTIDINI